VLADSEITNLPPEDGGSAAWAVGTFGGKGGTRMLILHRTGRP
jgi:hypothetical protein